MKKLTLEKQFVMDDKKLKRQSTRDEETGTAGCRLPAAGKQIMLG